MIYFNKKGIASINLRNNLYNFNLNYLINKYIFKISIFALSQIHFLRVVVSPKCPHIAAVFNKKDFNYSPHEHFKIN